MRFDGWDDDALVARAQGGDVVAFEELVRRHAGVALALALRVLGSRADAEDAVQEALVSAWRRLGTFRQDAAFSTWLQRVVYRTCLSQLRSRRRVEPLEDHDVALPGADGAAEAGQVREALLRALRVLTPEQRACWVLREVQGLSYEEVAQVVDVSPATVRGRLHRARLRLAEELAPWR